VPFDYFLYDSSKLGQVRNFATSATIQVMVVTVGAINKKDVNNLYKDSEKTGGEKPIDLIRATRPIVIVDEPQSVDGGLKARQEALDAMNPLCTLRYSATHVDKHHMVYRLDARGRLRAQAGQADRGGVGHGGGRHNKAYVRLVSVRNKRGTISAKVELDVQTATGVKRKSVTVRTATTWSSHRARASTPTFGRRDQHRQGRASSWSCATPAAKSFWQRWGRPTATSMPWPCSAR
jgi:type III restriction enzyme